MGDRQGLLKQAKRLLKMDEPLLPANILRVVDVHIFNFRRKKAVAFCHGFIAGPRRFQRVDGGHGGVALGQAPYAAQSFRQNRSHRP